MKYFVLIVGLSLLGFSGSANAKEPASIRDLLLGNSITNPRFGCLFYRDEKTAEYFLNGNNLSYAWSVVDNLYVSGSNCGATGCEIKQMGDQLTFSAVEIDYSITAKLHKGNYCDGNLVSSTQYPTLKINFPPT